MNATENRFDKNRRRARHGSTLIDVAIGSMLMVSLLIPSLNLISQSQHNTQRLAIRQALLQTAEQEMETLKVRLSEPSVFMTTRSRPINEDRSVTTSMGIPARLRVQAAADTTVAPASLLTLRVQAWYDEDGDNSLDANEIVNTLRTQWATPR